MTITRSTAALVLSALFLLTACGGGGSDDTGPDDTGPDDTTAALSSYDSVTELADGLAEAGITCTLEYEGLVDDTREVSLCAVNGEYTELSVWTDAAEAATSGAAAEAAGDPFVEGANWTIDVETAPTATAIAEALGGTARGV